jgi:NAD(P)-dependent dehydrogenase (short-subunit alcohol dehydrogenase family)
MDRSLFSVADKVVIVTGAARGNGKTIGKGFLHYGSVVYFVDILKEVKETVSSLSNNKAHAIVCDLTNKDAMKAMVKDIVRERDRIDVLINNAAISLQRDDPYDDEVWAKTLAVNLDAVFSLSKLVSGIMVERKIGGVIINITSLGAELGFPGNPSYSASKGGVRQLTKAMARDWAKHKIRVNNICPGYILTDMTKKSYNIPELKAERDRRMMLDRWGKSEDLVGPCIFLASDASAYITGIDLPVDGGWLAKGL